MTCAVYGDMIGELLRIGLDTGTVGTMTSAILSRSVSPSLPRHRDMLGTDLTIGVMPVGSSKRAEGGVMLRRPKLSGVLTFPEARVMAQNWMEAANASTMDNLVDAVLTRTGLLDPAALDAVFDYLLDLRSGEAELPPAREPSA